MRTFVIIQPGLSVGQPGTTVSQAQLRMSDDKIDEWVQAGYGIEVYADHDKPAGRYIVAPADTELDDLDDEFSQASDDDYSDPTVAAD